MDTPGKEADVPMKSDSGLDDFLTANRSATPKRVTGAPSDAIAQTARNEAMRLTLQDAKDCFKLMDKDQDGFLNYDDLVFSCFAAREHLEESNIQTMIEYASHKTGRVSLSDFLEIMYKKELKHLHLRST